MLKHYQKILFLALASYFLSGCGGVSPLTPSTQELKVDQKLPKVTLTQNGVVTDMNAVAFEWKSIKDFDVDGVKIYKASSDENVTSLLTTIENKYSTHYVDLDVSPNQAYHYILRSYKDDSVSAANDLGEIHTKPVLASVSWIYAINGLPRMAKIIWRPHPNKRVESYIIERRTVDDEEWEQIATVKGRLQAEYIDTGLRDKYTYKYRIRVKTFDDIVSTPSEIVQVITKPLPPAIVGLSATIDLPKKIEIKWDKSTYKDFERYYLYRSTSKDGTYELRAKLYNNHFTDEINEDGVKYFYKVTQKDIDGLESPDNGMIVLGSTLAKPFAPTIKDLKQQGKTIYLSWFKIDPRSVSYIVKRKATTGWFDTEEKEFKTDKREFIDTNIKPNTKYTYSIYAVDKYGIISPESQSVSIEVEDLDLPDLSKPTPPSPAAQEVPQEEVISVDNVSVEAE